MTENTPAAPDRSGTGYPQPPDCRPDMLDKLKCKAAGVKAQADYNTAHDAELTKARTDYETARIQYRTVRDAAKKTYEDLGAQLEKVLEQLRCLIDDSEKVGLLDDAFANVEERLARCPGQSGCYFTDTCDFDDLVRCPPKDIAGKIKEIEARIAAAKTVFDDLVKEPTALPTRVTAVKSEVDAIVAAMATDSRSVDFGSLYVRALVAQSHRDNLWRGFDDGNAYVDCLCRALLCQLKGHEAVARLKRREAVNKCKDDAWTAHCTDLRDHTDVAVLEEYERLKAGHQGGDYGQPGGGYGEQGGGYGEQGGGYGEQGGGYGEQGGGHGEQGGGHGQPGAGYGEQGGGHGQPGGGYGEQGGGHGQPGAGPGKPGGGQGGQGGGDYSTEQGGGDYPAQQGGVGYEDQPDDDYDDPDEDGGPEPGGDYEPPRGGEPDGGYGEGAPPYRGRDAGSERRPGRPGRRESRG